MVFDAFLTHDCERLTRRTRSVPQASLPRMPTSEASSTQLSTPRRAVALADSATGSACRARIADSAPPRRRALTVWPMRDAIGRGHRQRGPVQPHASVPREEEARGA
eukprot:4035195-Prymnesium_polylepis.1